MHLHNHVQLIGRVGNDPDLIALSDGTRRVTLRLYLAGSRSDGLASASTNPAYRIVAWQDLARSLHRKVQRGDTLLVQGHLVNRSLTTEGRTYVRTEVHATEFRLLSSRSITRTVGLAAEPPAPAFGKYE